MKIPDFRPATFRIDPGSPELICSVLAYSLTPQYPVLKVPPVPGLFPGWVCVASSLLARGSILSRAVSGVKNFFQKFENLFLPALRSSLLGLRPADLRSGSPLRRVAYYTEVIWVVKHYFESSQLCNTFFLDVRFALRGMAFWSSTIRCIRVALFYQNDHHIYV